MHFYKRTMVFILSLFAPILGHQGFEESPRWARDAAIWLDLRCGWYLSRLARRYATGRRLQFGKSGLGLSRWFALGCGFDLGLPLHEDRD
jgi:hypothetical protein